MKLLLIGPYPPPHGGISVHVTEARNQLMRAGVEVRVLNTDRQARVSESCLTLHNSLQLVFILIRDARQGWVFHLHTNGHNRKSWLLAFLCGLAGQLGPGCLLTLHSGMTPNYLQQCSGWRRYFARFICSLYDRVIGVNMEIQKALIGLGVGPEKMEVLPAYLATAPSATIPATLKPFFEDHWPIFTTVLFFRPEYGFDFLLQALARLRNTYPKLGCLVMGGGDKNMAAQLLVLKQGIGDAVNILGDVPHELCLTLISHSDVFFRCTFSDGDAISVREALSFGVPTVASDVGHRPPGALLFEPGNLDGMIAQVDVALNGVAMNGSSVSAGGNTKLENPSTVSTGFQRLLEMYQQLALEGVRQ